MPKEVNGLSPFLASRWCRFFPYLLAPDADVSIYVDGNIRILGPLMPIIKDFLDSRHGMGLFRHPCRQNIRAEAKACVKYNKLDDHDLQLIWDQVLLYEKSGVPIQGKLTENGVIFRNHHDTKLKETMELWWHELVHGVKRDQISLPWVRSKTKISTLVSNSYRENNPYFSGPFRHRPNSGKIGGFIQLIEATRSDSIGRAILYFCLQTARKLKGRLSLHKSR